MCLIKKKKNGFERLIIWPCFALFLNLPESKKTVEILQHKDFFFFFLLRAQKWGNTISRLQSSLIAVICKIDLIFFSIVFKINEKTNDDRFLIALVFVVACTIAFPTEGGKIKNIADVDGWRKMKIENILEKKKNFSFILTIPIFMFVFLKKRWTKTKQHKQHKQTQTTENSGFYMAIWNTNLLCKGKPDVNISADTQCHSFYSQNTYWWTRVSCWNTTMYQQNYFSDTACMNPTTNWGMFLFLF